VVRVRFCADGYFPLGEKTCIVWATMDVLLCTASIWHMATISVDRYCSLRFPLRYRRTKSPIFVATKIAFVWIVSVGICSVLGVAGLVNPSNVYHGGRCIPAVPQFVIYGSVFAFYIPLAVMFASYALTVRALSPNVKSIATTWKDQLRRHTTVAYHLAQRSTIRTLTVSNHNHHGGTHTPELRLLQEDHATQNRLTTAPDSARLCGRDFLTSGEDGGKLLHWAKSTPEMAFISTTGSRGCANVRVRRTASHSELPPVRVAPKQNDGYDELDDDVIGDMKAGQRRLNNCRCATAVSLPSLSTTKNQSKHNNNSNNKNVDHDAHNYNHNVDNSGDYETQQLRHVDSCRNRVIAAALLPSMKTSTKLVKYDNIKNDSRDNDETKQLPQSDTSGRDHVTATVLLPVGTSQSAAAREATTTNDDGGNSVSNQGLVSTDHHATVPVRRYTSPAQMSRKVRPTAEVRQSVSGTTKHTKRKATHVLGVMFVVFVVMWTPFFTLNLLSAVCPACVRPLAVEVWTVLVWLGWVSSLANPVIYTSFSPAFRAAFKRLLTCRSSRRAAKCRQRQATSLPPRCRHTSSTFD